MVLLSEHWLTSFVFTLLRTPGGQPLKHSAYGSRAFAGTKKPMAETYNILRKPISLHAESRIGFAILYVIMDTVFTFYRESPPFQGQHELTYTMFGLLALLGMLASIGSYSCIWKVSGLLRVLAAGLFIYSSLCVLSNSFWFVMVFFCLPCA